MATKTDIKNLEALAAQYRAAYDRAVVTYKKRGEQLGAASPDEKEALRRAYNAAKKTRNTRGLKLRIANAAVKAAK